MLIGYKKIMFNETLSLLKYILQFQVNKGKKYKIQKSDKMNFKGNI